MTTQHTSSFLWIARYASALACGVAAGFLYSIKHVNPALELEIGVGSGLAALFGGWLALFLWKQAMRMAERVGEGDSPASLRPQRRALIIVSVTLFLVMMLSYLAALKDVRSSALLQVLQGTGFALLVIGGICAVMVHLVRLLNREQPPDGTTGEPPDRDDA